MDLDMLGLSQRQYPSGGDSSKAEMGCQKITHGGGLRICPGVVAKALDCLNSQKNRRGVRAVRRT